MEATNWWKYVEELIGDDTFSTAAARAGFDKSAFTRWKRGAAADPAFAVKLARAYRSNVLDALVQAELITEEEADLRIIEPGARLTDRELIQKVAYRIDADPAAWFGTFGELEEVADVHDLHPTATPDVQAEPYAAHTREPEPEEGDDDYGDGA